VLIFADSAMDPHGRILEFPEGEKIVETNKNQILWLESVNELYRTSDRRLSAKIVPIFVDRGCRVVSAASREYDRRDPSC
jgi:hypothetical protein